jgi:hypothetical protein
MRLTVPCVDKPQGRETRHPTSFAQRNMTFAAHRGNLPLTSPRLRDPAMPDGIPARFRHRISRRPSAHFAFSLHPDLPIKGKEIPWQN